MNSQAKTDAILACKGMRHALDGIIQTCKEATQNALHAPSGSFENLNEVAANLTLARRAMENATMRLGMALKHIGTPNPYPVSKLSVESVAEKLYEAYRGHTGGKSLATGQPIPQWEELPQAIKDAWMATAKASPGMTQVEPTADGLRM